MYTRQLQLIEKSAIMSKNIEWKIQTAITNVLSYESKVSIDI